MKMSAIPWAILAIVGLTVPATLAFSQQEKPKQVFAALYSRGSAWVEGKSPFEQQAIPEHVQHIQGLGERLIGAAPFDKDHADPEDRTVGLVVFFADDEADAREWAEADPSVEAKVMEAKVYSWPVEWVRAVDPRR